MVVDNILLRSWLTMTSLVVADDRSGRFVFCTSVHIQTVSSLELLATELTGNHFSHVRFYVVPHVLSDLT